MRAFILAGGLGTRLRSVVNDRPKPLAPIHNAPFLEYQLECLKGKGIREFVLCVGYLHEQIEEHFGDGARWGIAIEYSVEEEPLGTGGALKLAERFVDEPFLLLNGDTFFDLHLSELVAAHEQAVRRDENCWGTLALTEVADARECGTVELDAGQFVVAFREKSATAVGRQNVSAGVYLLAPHILPLIPENQKVSLERETFPGMLAAGRKLFGHRTDGFFIDIGTPQGYRQFQEHAGGVTS